MSQYSISAICEACSARAVVGDDKLPFRCPCGGMTLSVSDDGSTLVADAASDVSVYERWAASRRDTGASKKETV